MILDGLEVKHKAFGAGVVVSRNGKYITVRFDNMQKVFVYPDVFEKYMTLADGTVSEEIKSDLASASEVKERIRSEKDEENRRAMTHGIVIPGKEKTESENEEDEHYKNEMDEM